LPLLSLLFFEPSLGLPSPSSLTVQQQQPFLILLVLSYAILSIAYFVLSELICLLPPLLSILKAYRQLKSLLVKKNCFIPFITLELSK
jgi:uncharacterized protein YybS (DUF2232 family)